MRYTPLTVNLIHQNETNNFRKKNRLRFQVKFLLCFLSALQSIKNVTDCFEKLHRHENTYSLFALFQKHIMIQKKTFWRTSILKTIFLMSCVMFDLALVIEYHKTNKFWQKTSKCKSLCLIIKIFSRNKFGFQK